MYNVTKTLRVLTSGEQIENKCSVRGLYSSMAPRNTKNNGIIEKDSQFANTIFIIIIIIFIPLKNVPTAKRQSDWVEQANRPSPKPRRHIPGSAKSNAPPIWSSFPIHCFLLFHFGQSPLSFSRLAPISRCDSFSFFFFS